MIAYINERERERGRVFLLFSNLLLEHIIIILIYDEKVQIKLSSGAHAVLHVRNCLC